MNYKAVDTTAICPNCELSFITAEEAAEIIGVSYARVRAILNDKPERLGAFKIGRDWIIPKHAAKEFRPLPPHRPPKHLTDAS